MQLAHDYFRSFHGNVRCRVRVFVSGDSADAPVVLIDEPPRNPPSPVLDGVGQLALGIFHDHEPELRDRPVPVFIQHSAERGSYYLIVFSSPQKMKSGTLPGSPRWKALDRKTVEFLIGTAADGAA